jgi:lipopolysaccharide/colanic/teichoic acid biosynthesis glycosyltransferase
MPSSFVNVREAPEHKFAYPVARVRGSSRSDAPVLAVQQEGFYSTYLKRLLDVVISAFLLIILSPLFLLVSCAIYLISGHSPIFVHTRVGRGGTRFRMYKFRTMIDDRRQAFRHYTGQDRRRVHKSVADPRVTRLGQLLRRTSIDELPQLVNVLRGDMSLVGPRPELPEIVARYATWQHARHAVKPGITGWWQVQGRSQQMMHTATELDLYYVANQSFLLDASILIRTIPAVLSRRGAF